MMAIIFRIRYFIYIYWIAIREIFKGIFHKDRNIYDVGLDSQKFDVGKQESRCVAIVTGGSKGIGYEVCLQLSFRENYHVIIASHCDEEGEAAVKNIKNINPQSSVEFQSLDLADFDSVNDFVRRFKRRKIGLNLLVNNAGIMIPKYGVTKQGFESQFGVNYLGHFLLTQLLLDCLKTSASDQFQSRIVNVSSVVHEMGYINFEDLQARRSYSAHFSYSQSKIALILYTYELQRRLENCNVVVNCVNPGVVYTSLYQHAWAYKLMQFIGRYFMLTPKEGSATILYAALSPECSSRSCSYYDNCTRVPSSPLTYDIHLQNELWYLSHHLTQLHPMDKS
ncbi:polyprenol dehydrogenase-like [Tubulanus polymorphus]|uniref:polyprenol dehydrogenase-like n=1 Tax=Tubulanus polymorphus TaxID=672921 RepID=UPI003DA68FE4